MTSPDVLTEEEEKQVGKEVRGVLAGPKLAKVSGRGKLCGPALMKKLAGAKQNRRCPLCHACNRSKAASRRRPGRLSAARRRRFLAPKQLRLTPEANTSLRFYCGGQARAEALLDRAGLTAMKPLTKRS